MKINFQALKSIYGMILSSLMYYRKFAKEIKTEGFIINPYDLCVANKWVNEAQLTLVWHVADIKISHVDSKVVDNFILWLKNNKRI